MIVPGIAPTPPIQAPIPAPNFAPNTAPANAPEVLAVNGPGNKVAFRDPRNESAAEVASTKYRERAAVLAHYNNPVVAHKTVHAPVDTQPQTQSVVSVNKYMSV